MNDTLYLQFEQEIQISNPKVQLQDIAELSCINTVLLNRLRVFPVIHLKPGQPGYYVYTVTQIIDLIQKAEPNLSIQALGEPTFILTYTIPAKEKPCFRFLKTMLVCLLTFFGSAFSIMTFHNDVNLTTVFSDIYLKVTGQTSNGYTILEISYSIGIGVGVLFFFHHFGHMNFSSVPTPSQIQMSQYNSQIHAAIIEEKNQPDFDKKESATK